MKKILSFVLVFVLAIVCLAGAYGTVFAAEPPAPLIPVVMSESVDEPDPLASAASNESSEQETSGTATDDSLATSVHISPRSLTGSGTVDVEVVIQNKGNPVTNVQLKYPSPNDTRVTIGDLATDVSRTHSGKWTITEDMLDTPLYFTIYWTSSDGAEKSGDTQSFEITRQEQIVKVSGQSSASTNELQKGEQVQFVFDFKNEGNVTLENCKMTAPNLDGGAQIGETFSLSPGSTNHKTYTVTMQESMTVTPTYTYEAGGETYTYRMNPLNITVKEPQKTITMSATLNAHKDILAPGEEAEFTVIVTNTGESGLDGISVKDFDGNVVPMGHTSLTPGASTTGTASIPISITGDYQFTVSAVGAGGAAVEQRTNIVHIETDGAAQSTTDPNAVINADTVIQTYIHLSGDHFYGPSEVFVTATVENVTDEELSSVIVHNELIGTVGEVALLKPGEKKQFEKVFTAEETATYSFTTTAKMPDGTLIESKTNSATIVVDPPQGMDPTTRNFIIILVAIVVVAVILAIYIVRARKKAQRENAESEARKQEQAANHTPLNTYAQQRANGQKPTYPDRSVYTNRTPPPRQEIFSAPPPRNVEQPQPGPSAPEVPQPGAKKPAGNVKFGDRNKI